jgi:uncharacterized membrane protein
MALFLAFIFFHKAIAPIFDFVVDDPFGHIVFFAAIICTLILMISNINHWQKSAQKNSHRLYFCCLQHGYIHQYIF